MKLKSIHGATIASIHLIRITWPLIMSNSIHCPLCNTKKVMGLGLVIYEQSALVQYKCCDCSELFFLPDQRGQLPTQIAEQSDQVSVTGASARIDSQSKDGAAN